MKIKRTDENGAAVISPSGELTAATAEQLGAALEAAIGETDNLVLDFEGLEYVASAGLRVLLRTKKAMDLKAGRFAIRNVSEPVMRVFEITGFDGVLTIE